jgi:hypothetical protein
MIGLQRQYASAVTNFLDIEESGGSQRVPGRGPTGGIAPLRLAFIPRRQCL